MVVCPDGHLFLCIFAPKNPMEQPKKGRLLQIMMALASDEKPDIQELTHRFGICERTLYRYIDTFRQAGFYIRRDGNKLHLDYTSPVFKDISELIYFTKEEAYLLRAAIDSIEETNWVKQNLKKKLYSVYDYKMLADVVVNHQNVENVQKLIDCIKQQRKAIFHDYHSPHSNSVSKRVVEPFAFTTNFVQVWCYEEYSGQVKLFTVARIGTVEVTEMLWDFPDQHRKDFIDIFRMHGPVPHDIKLQLKMRAATLLMEEYPLSKEFLFQKDENTWILDVQVAQYEGVTRFILGLFSDVEVLENDGLKRYINERIRELHPLVV